MNHQTSPLIHSDGMLSPPCTWGIPAILPRIIFDMHKGYHFARVPHHNQVGINCGAFDVASRSLKVIDNHVIIDFLDKNAVIARFRDKNYLFELFDKNKVFTLKKSLSEYDCLKNKQFNLVKTIEKQNMNMVDALLKM